jgi:hypothetical protein
MATATTRSRLGDWWQAYTTQSTIYQRHAARRYYTEQKRRDSRPAAVRVLTGLLPAWWLPTAWTAAGPASTPLFQQIPADDSRRLPDAYRCQEDVMFYLPLETTESTKSIDSSRRDIGAALAVGVTGGYVTLVSSQRSLHSVARQSPFAPQHGGAGRVLRLSPRSLPLVAATTLVGVASAVLSPWYWSPMTDKKNQQC